MVLDKVKIGVGTEGGERVWTEFEEGIAYV